MNRYLVINELEVYSSREPLIFNNQFVELFDGNLGTSTLDGLLFVTLQNDTK